MTAVVASAKPAMRAYLDLVATVSRAGVSHPDRLAGLGIRLRGKLHHHAGAADHQYLACRGAAGRHCADGAVCVPAAGPIGQCPDHAGCDPLGRTCHRGLLAAQGLAEAARQSQSDHLLCRRRRLLRLCRRADRVRVRACDLRLSGADHGHAADGAGRPHGRGHEPPDPAVGAAVCISRPADRDDGHGARHGGVSGEPVGPCPRRAALRAGRRDVSGVGHLGLEGRRHGCRGAGAVSGNEGAGRQAGRSGRPALRDRRADRDHSAEPGADHHRLGHGCVDRGVVHRRPVAGPGAGHHAVGAGVVALPRARICGMSRGRAAARSAARLPSPCPPSRCHS